MSRRLKIAGIIGGTLVLIFLFRFYFSDPDVQLTKKYALESMEETYTEVEVDTIQDVIIVEKKYAFVPFISKQNEYGMGFFVWRNHSWQVDAIHEKGEPHLLKVKKNDPSSYRLVWNIHPDDQVERMEFHYVRERGYFGDEEQTWYEPRVQLKQEADLGAGLYGVMALTDEWLSVMDSLQSSGDESRNPFFSVDDESRIIWITYDSAGEQTYPDHFMNGEEYSGSTIRLETIISINEQELE
ncbi:MAG: hypothetical protein ACI4XL_12795 [Bacillus sp. (in: firmicutes)]